MSTIVEAKKVCPVKIIREMNEATAWFFIKQSCVHEMIRCGVGFEVTPVGGAYSLVWDATESSAGTTLIVELFYEGEWCFVKKISKTDSSYYFEAGKEVPTEVYYIV